MVSQTRGRSRSAGWAAALAAALLVTTAASAADVTGLLYGASFKDLHDQTKSFGQFRGKVLVLYFWATWCVPCRVETPNLAKLNQEYEGKPVEVVGLALDNGDKVRDFVREMKLTYPIFYGGRDAVELGKTLGNSEGAIPFTVIVDQHGKLLQTFKGDLPNSDLERLINPLIS